MAKNKGKRKKNKIVKAEQVGLSGDIFSKELLSLDALGKETEIKKGLLIKEALSTDDPTPY